MRIPAPNHTQTPNDLFDHWLPHLGEAELKVLLVIMRKTFGWHKTHDKISISQLARITGMLEETVVKAARSLQSKGVINREVVGPNGKQKTIYSLVVEEDSNKSYPSVEPSGPLGLNPPVKTEGQKKPSYPKETTTKEREAGGPAVAVPLPEKKAEKKKPVIYAILDKIDIPHGTKVKLTNEFEEETVRNAIGWATHPSNPPRQSLGASIRFACNEGLSAKEFDNKKKATQDIEQANKAYAMKYDRQVQGYFSVEVFNKYVQINTGNPTRCFCLGYSEKGFMEQFKNALRKHKFKILEES